MLRSGGGELTRISGAQLAYERMKAMIGNGEILPGTRISEAEVSALLGLGRTPVREALERLHAEGFVIRSANGRLAVASLSVREAADLFAVRVVLEEMVAEEATRNATPESLDGLRKTVTAMELAASAGLGAEVARYGEEFHYRLLEMAGNAVTKRLLQNLREHIRRYRSVAPKSDIGRCEIAAREHRQIYEAVASRDAEKAGRLMREHLRNSTVALLQSLKELPGIGEAESGSQRGEV